MNTTKKLRLGPTVNAEKLILHMLEAFMARDSGTRSWLRLSAPADLPRHKRRLGGAEVGKGRQRPIRMLTQLNS